MSNDQDLFTEEKSMVTMSFGDHIEELRVRLILALLGLFFGLVVVFLPPLDIAWWVMKSMERPAKIALDEFYRAEYEKKAKQAREKKSVTPTASGDRRGRLVHRPSSRRSPPSWSFPSRKLSKVKR